MQVKLPSVIKIFVLSFFGWPLKTGFTALANSVDPDWTAPILFDLMLYVQVTNLSVMSGRVFLG